MVRGINEGDVQFHGSDVRLTCRKRKKMMDLFRPLSPTQARILKPQRCRTLSTLLISLYRFILLLLKVKDFPQGVIAMTGCDLRM